LGTQPNGLIEIHKRPTLVANLLWWRKLGNFNTKLAKTSLIWDI